MSTPWGVFQGARWRGLPSTSADAEVVTTLRSVHVTQLTDSQPGITRGTHAGQVQVINTCMAFAGFFQYCS